MVFILVLLLEIFLFGELWIVDVFRILLFFAGDPSKGWDIPRFFLYDFPALLHFNCQVLSNLESSQDAEVLCKVNLNCQI